MRTVILLTGMMIAGAINPESELADQTITFIGVVFMVSIIMDIVEFIETLKRG